jgi:hypothetical protein
LPVVAAAAETQEELVRIVERNRAHFPSSHRASQQSSALFKEAISVCVSGVRVSFDRSLPASALVSE